MGNSIIAPETGWEYERKKKENESCHAHRAKLQVPFGKVQLILTNHLFILESYKKKNPSSIQQSLFSYLPSLNLSEHISPLLLLLLFLQAIAEEACSEFRTLIAVGSIFLKSSSLSIVCR